MEAGPVIEASRLVKKYGRKVVLRDISFRVGRGETVGFLGPNGAGKSTTMNILAGCICPAGGTVKIGGIDMGRDPVAAKKKIGYLPEHPPLYLDLTVQEQLQFVSGLKRIGPARKVQIARVCELAGIGDVRRAIIGSLSKGYRQRVGLAQALLGDPEVLILDEPTVGLDPAQIIEIRRLIRDFGRDRTVIFSSHILSEVSAVCERVLVIHQGRMLADDSSENLTRLFAGGQRLLARIEGKSGAVMEIIGGLAGVASCEAGASLESGTRDYIITAEQGRDIRRALFDAMARCSFRLLLLKPLERSLEEAFLELVKKAGGVEEP